MKKISQFSVDYPITVLMLVLCVVLLGAISFGKLGMDLFPDLNNPRIFVELRAGERPPQEIEERFIRPIESQAIRQKNVISVSSISSVGAGRVTVEYSWNTNMDEAFLELQKALSSARQNSEIDELTISQRDPNAEPIIILALSHPTITDMDELRKIAESYLRNELIRVEGIADVRLLGLEEKEVVIETNPYLLQAYGVTPATLASRINEYNRNVTGGSITESGRQYVIQGVGEFGSLEEIGQVIVSNRQPGVAGGTVATGVSSEQVPVYLRDLASITLRNKKPDNIVHLNGKRCIGIAVYKEMKYNTVKAVDEFMTTLDRTRRALPGYELTVIQNKARFITSAIDEVKSSALIGIFLAILILYVFLRRIGSTLIISLSIPVSIIATFNLMFFNGLTLNIMTLGGLALGAGMLVDNAIVVLENIFRLLEEGVPLKEAAVAGAGQVGGAITASTLTTIVVFLPIVYLHGSEGELFKDQAWTVAFSLVSSLAVAMLLIPMLCSKILKQNSKVHKINSLQFPGYSSFLMVVLKHKFKVLLFAGMTVAASIALVPYIGSDFIPRTDTGEFSVEVILPSGTELSTTQNITTTLESKINDVLGDELESIFSVIGPSTEVLGSGRISSENTASINITLSGIRQTPMTTLLAMVGRVLEDVPDVETRIIHEQSALELTMGSESSPIIVEIQGTDFDIIQNLTDQTFEKLSGITDLFNVQTSFDEGRPEIEIVLDRVRAGIHNIGINTVTSQLTSRLEGTRAGQWETRGEMQDITVHMPTITIEEIKNLPITSGNNSFLLHEIASVRTTTAPKEILRKNQVRIGQVSAHIQSSRPLDHIVRDISTALDQIAFPPDYKYDISGEEQHRRQAFRNLGFALILSLILVYMVMASQFESLMHPFTVMLSIPTAFVGVVVIFLFAGKSFDIMAFIGMIMLGGIAVNDSIILVDAINQLRYQGLGIREAVIAAGQRRIRPILMTTMTTILALLPLTFGFGEGAALRSSMALAVIGGLITSTILTLIIIPCAYSAVESLSGNKESA